jgi:hypothetical protein
MKTVALIQDLPWSMQALAGHGRNQSRSRTVCSGSIATVFRARKENMKNESSLADQKDNEGSAVLPSPGGEGRMRAFSLSSFDIYGKRRVSAFIESVFHHSER